jgi:imidazolonepropionase-like amidohydrolase
VSESFVLEDVEVFDGTRFTGRHDVVVDDGLISAVTPARAAAATPAARTLLPGFVDAHVHLGFFAPADVLRGGVTTARDLGWPLERLDELGAADGPALLYAGQMLTARGGYPSRAAWAPRGTAREIRDAADARAAVAEQAARGASVVKIAQDPRAGPVMAPEVVRAVCDEAHARGLRVTSHCGALEQLHIALDAGVDELAHGLWSDERIDDGIIERMVRARMTVVPTLHIDPSPERIENTRRFVEAGGHVVYGTDMGNPPLPPGIDVEELRLMVRAGMALGDALAAATSCAAAHLGLEDRGRIEPGARADLVVVNGDPRDDISALAHPALVARGGVRA